MVNAFLIYLARTGNSVAYDCKLLAWTFGIQCDAVTKANRADELDPYGTLNIAITFITEWNVL